MFFVGRSDEWVGVAGPSLQGRARPGTVPLGRGLQVQVSGIGEGMYERVSVITRKGQVTLPAEIRRALGLREGDKVVFELEDATGRITVRPVRSVADRTYGAVAPRQWPEDLAALRERAIEEIAEEVLAETPSEHE